MGYLIVGNEGRGWLSRCHYTVPENGDCFNDVVRRFLLDLEQVIEILDLTVVGWEPRSGSWYSFTDLAALARRHNGENLLASILAAGASLMRRGESDRGLTSRWYPVGLAKRILDIATLGDKVSFVHGDGLKLMHCHAEERRTAWFIDPPYPGAGRRLYTHWNIDHRKLFLLASRLSGDFLLTYEDSDLIRDLAEEFEFSIREIGMTTTHNAKKRELLISRNLDWAD